MFNNSYNRKKSPRGIGRVLYAILLTASVLLSCILLLSYLAPYINPNKFIWFSALGLAAPLLYLLNLLVGLYWAIKWRRVALLCLGVAAVGLLHLDKFVNLQFTREYHKEQKSKANVRILTYNIAGFWGDDLENNPVDRFMEVVTFIRSEEPDIVALQECEVNYLHPQKRLNQALSELKYHALSYKTGSEKSTRQGLAIYSKYPILDHGNIAFENSNRKTLWADLLIKEDTLRIFNLHLQSTEVNQEDREFIAQESLGDSLLNEKAKGILLKLNRNFQKRALQADSAELLITQSPHPVVVCGDFNDTPLSYTYQTIRGDLTDAFQEQGNGFISTYRGLYGLFRIDYIFHDKRFETLDYRCETPQWSDHYPVIVDLKLNP